MVYSYAHIAIDKLCYMVGPSTTPEVGITVHGTHQARVSNNVMWNTMSAGVYIEDGSGVVSG